MSRILIILGLVLIGLFLFGCTSQTTKYVCPDGTVKATPSECSGQQLPLGNQTESIGTNVSISTQENVSKPTCGDGKIQASEECDPPEDICVPIYGESCIYCNDSCKKVTLQGEYCGDNKCQTNENCKSCDKDCYCSDGYSCSPARTNIDSKGCYKITCGDSFCDAPIETQNNCCNDCNCPSGYTCQNNLCIELAPNIKIISTNISTQSAAQLRSIGETLNTCIKNEGNDIAQNIKIAVSSPTNYFGAVMLDGGSLRNEESNCYNAKLNFYDSVLNIASQTQDQIDLDITHTNSLGKEYSTKGTTTYTIEGRNYFSWSDKPSVSMYVTPNQPAIKQFASRSTGGLATYANSIEQLLAAKWIFANMRAYGIKYVTDVHSTADYVQFPYDTLKNKGGDCEDNAIFFASMLEAIGMTSVIIVIPGHAYSGYVNKEGYIVPIETTASTSDQMLTTIPQGATIIYPSREWSKYPQVIIPETSELPMPAISKQKGSCKSSWNLDLGYYIYAPVRFTNTGNAPGAGCAALIVYNQSQIIGSDLKCWGVNPGQTLDVNYVYDIDMASLGGSSCFVT